MHTYKDTCMSGYVITGAMCSCTTILRCLLLRTLWVSALRRKGVSPYITVDDGCTIHNMSYIIFVSCFIYVTIRVHAVIPGKVYRLLPYRYIV